MRISDWSSDVCSSDLFGVRQDQLEAVFAGIAGACNEYVARPRRLKLAQCLGARAQIIGQQWQGQAPRLPPLYGEDAEIVTAANLDLKRRGLLANPHQILVGRTGIDDQTIVAVDRKSTRLNSSH